MYYEQKYKRILDDARYWHDVSEGDIPAVLEEIFPELQESDDEKIRKKLIHLVNKSNEYGGYALHKWEADEMLAWLEKQGQQKHIEKDLEMVNPSDKAEQKSDWSEDDERAFYHVLSVLEEYGKEHPSKSKFVCNWLKSIKARMEGDKV